MTNQSEVEVDDDIPDFVFDQPIVPGNVKKAMSEGGANSCDMWMVPVESLRILPNFNVRIKNAKYHAVVQTTKRSMVREGYKKQFPLAGIVTREGDKNVISIYGGHRRFEALHLANAENPGGPLIQKVPVIIAPAGTSIEDLHMDLKSGNTDGGLELYETGILCKRMIGFQWEEERIAEHFEIELDTVRDLLLLMGSPPELRQQVEKDLMSVTQAVKMVKKYGDKVVKVLEKAQEKAKSQNKDRVTARFMPGAGYQKALKTTAPKMVSTLKDVQADPAFANLAPGIREKLEALLRDLSKVEQDEIASKAEQGAGDQPAAKSPGTAAAVKPAQAELDVETTA